jgi:uncharacterized caspase-like protein
MVHRRRVNNLILILSSGFLLLQIGCASTSEGTKSINSSSRAVKINNTTTSMSQEKRVALVIGNNNYQGVMSKLSNPVNDAKSIRDILSRRGFDVIYREDVSKKSLRDSLGKFYSKISKGGVGMLYFSGHGLEVDGQNYLIPVDANIKAKSDTEFEAIALNKITKRMQNAGNRLNIVVLDACRNDPFTKAIGVGGLAKAEPIGLFVSYATGAGKVASDGKVGENGLFTKSLIKHMKQPLDLQEVFQKSREEVYRNSHQKQFPAIYNQTINGKFFFTLPDEARSQVKASLSTTAYQVPTHQSVVSISSTKFIIASPIKEKITVDSLSSRVENQLLETIIDIQNKTDKDITLQYRYRWFDESGMEVSKNMAIWKPLFLEASDNSRLKKSAFNPKAVSCKIYFK